MGRRLAHQTGASLLYLCWIGYPLSIDLGHGCNGMGFGAFRGEYIHNINAADDQCISDEGTVAAPGDRFGAHDGSSLLTGQLNKLHHGYCKLRCLHVIGKAAERNVVPAGIEGIGDENGVTLQALSYAGNRFDGYAVTFPACLC